MGTTEFTKTAVVLLFIMADKNFSSDYYLYNTHIHESGSQNSGGRR